MAAREYAENAPGALIRLGTDDVFGFLPDPLPPRIETDLALTNLLSEATHALGTLNGLGQTLSNPYLLIRPFLRREAVASSRIEGTQTELDQLLLFEASEDTETAGSDVREVENYVRALEYGLGQPSDRAISTALIKEMHAILMAGVRGGDRHPGSFRNVQVYIGQRGSGIRAARFIPPPPTEVPALMRDLERHIGEPSDIPALIRIALIHYQFESIHPFEDGNGRLGRVLIPMLLGSWRMLDRPLLYLSDYFERYRDDYLDRLLYVSRDCDWRGWIDFFLLAVRTQATDALQRGKDLLRLREHYRQRYQVGGSVNLLRVVDELFASPAVTISGVASRLEIAYTSAKAAIATLQSDGVLEERTGRRRGRVYTATEIMEILGHPSSN